jgi:hypothetical protein
VVVTRVPGETRSLDISYQVEDAKDGSLPGRPGSQVQPHIANEDHDLLICPSDRNGPLGHIAEERKHRTSSRRPPSLARAPDPEPGRHGSQND